MDIVIQATPNKLLGFVVIFSFFCLEKIYRVKSAAFISLFSELQFKFS